MVSLVAWCLVSLATACACTRVFGSLPVSCGARGSCSVHSSGCRFSHVRSCQQGEEAVEFSVEKVAEDCKQSTVDVGDRTVSWAD
jgi:hypothetical protein